MSTTTIEAPTATVAEEQSWAVRWVEHNRHPLKGQGRGKPMVRVQQPPMSAIGRTAADILHLTFDGIYNAPLNVERAKWHDQHCLSICVRGDLCTYDSNRLTRLVVLCHDYAVRLEIEAAGPRYLRLTFHQRKRLEPGQSCWEGHPTMEQATERVRKGTR